MNSSPQQLNPDNWQIDWPSKSTLFIGLIAVAVFTAAIVTCAAQVLIPELVSLPAVVGAPLLVAALTSRQRQLEDKAWREYEARLSRLSVQQLKQLASDPRMTGHSRRILEAHLAIRLLPRTAVR